MFKHTPPVLCMGDWVIYVRCDRARERVCFVARFVAVHYLCAVPYNKRVSLKIIDSDTMISTQMSGIERNIKQFECLDQSSVGVEHYSARLWNMFGGPCSGEVHILLHGLRAAIGN